MSAIWAAVLGLVVAQVPASSEVPSADPTTEVTLGSEPVAEPRPVPAIVPRPVLLPAHVYARPVGPIGPVVPDVDMLDQAYGGYYLLPKGRGLRIGGAVTLGYGIALVVGALACTFTGAGLSDEGDHESARMLLYTAVGLGIGGLAMTGGGAAMLAVGKVRRRRYHEWLLQQHRSPPGPPLRGSSRPELMLGPGRVGLAYTVQF